MTTTTDPVDEWVEEALAEAARGRPSVDTATLGERLAARFQLLIREQRSWMADMADLLAEVERTQTFVADGHRALTGWCRALSSCSVGQAARWGRVSRLCAAMPVVAAALAEGRVGVEQVQELSRTYANPRVRAYFPEYIDALLRDASRSSFDEFRATLLQWENLLDQDGPEPRADRAHRDRFAQIDSDGCSTRLTASLGNTDGAEIQEILARYCDAEFRTDCEAARARWGEDGYLGHLPRTARQRAADALHRLFVDAASAKPGGTTPDPLLNVTVDLATFEDLLADLAADAAEAADLVDLVDELLDDDEPVIDEDDGAAAAGAGDGNDRPPRPLRRVARPAEPRWWRCESQHGVSVPRAAALEAMLLGHVRRVVLDSAGVVVDAGRRRRVFTGVQREMVMRSARWCTTAGCAVPARHCQADHTLDHRLGGQTATDNGGPRCGHHNRAKNRGFAVWRDPEGYWHTYRPDGTEVR